MNRADTPNEKPNCLCGRDGSARNEGECKDRRTCVGCGFDKTEYRRRMQILRERGLTVLKDGDKERLRRNWGMDASLELRGMFVGRKII